MKIFNKVAVGCDHAAYEEKQKLIAYLIRQGYDMTTIRHALDIAWEDE